MASIVIDVQDFGGIDNATPTTPGWNTTAIYVGDRTAGANSCRATLKFSLASIPALATINSAILSMYAHIAAVDGGPNPATYSVFRLLNAFVKTQCTWNNRSNGNPWNTAGGGGSGTDIAASATAAVPIVSAADVWRTWDLTADVAAFIGGSATNHGWLLAALDAEELPSNQNYIRWRTPLHSNPPILTVDYTEYVAPPTPSVSTGTPYPFSRGGPQRPFKFR